MQILSKLGSSLFTGFDYDCCSLPSVNAGTVVPADCPAAKFTAEPFASENSSNVVFS